MRRIITTFALLASLFLMAGSALAFEPRVELLPGQTFVTPQGDEVTFAFDKAITSFGSDDIVITVPFHATTRSVNLIGKALMIKACFNGGPGLNEPIAKGYVAALFDVNGEMTGSLTYTYRTEQAAVLAVQRDQFRLELSVGAVTDKVGDTSVFAAALIEVGDKDYQVVGIVPTVLKYVDPKATEPIFVAKAVGNLGPNQ